MQTSILPATLFSGLAGLFTVGAIINLNTTIQLSIENEYRSRVMSLYTLAYFGFTPFAALLMGALANQLGTWPLMLIFALLGILSTIFVSLQPKLAKQRGPLLVAN
jgi:MFS family permease